MFRRNLVQIVDTYLRFLGFKQGPEIILTTELQSLEDDKILSTKVVHHSNIMIRSVSVHMYQVTLVNK